MLLQGNTLRSLLLSTLVDLIISGGNTGADQGGLFAAKELGIPTGGYAPKGWKTEAGAAPWLADYGLMESESPDYVDRTKDNVRMADATIIFGMRSVGSNKTEEYCRLLNKPCLWVWFPDTSVQQIPTMVRLWLKRNNVKTLNVAGNRLSKNPGIDEYVKEFLMEVLK